MVVDFDVNDFFGGWVCLWSDELSDVFVVFNDRMVFGLIDMFGVFVLVVENFVGDVVCFWNIIYIGDGFFKVNLVGMKEFVLLMDYLVES